MIVQAIKTHVVTTRENIFNLLDTYLPKLHERDVLAVTSKIIGICEGRVVKINKNIDKKSLIIKEANYYIDDPNMSKYNILLTVKNGNLVASSGIDESNGNGSYIFWPKDPDKTASDIWNHIRDTRHIRHVGVVITDSKTTPLRWGVTGFGIAWCGFKPLKNYTGSPDLFGRPFVYEQTSIVDSLAAVGAFVMGEGDEQTPLAIISDAPHVTYMNRPPKQKERNELKIVFKDDIYAPLTNTPLWKKGGQK
jgi:dihydrofolate synthase / folylpolyglutamate synthase